VQGKLAEADRYVREGAKIDEDRGALDGYLAAMARLAQMQVQYQSAATASATMASALARHPLATLPASDRPYTFIAMADAMTGHGEDARRLMAEYARAVPPGVLASDPDRLAVNGYLASAAGHWADAISAFQSARVENNCVNCYLFEIAESFGKLGQPDSARAYFVRYLALGGPYRIYQDAQFRALTFQRLGELAEQSGDKKAAVEYYEKLIDLWKNADPELQPIVKDARARVTRLTSEH
jgi:tetratricopeptide (TPR) repeat protein